MTTFNLRRDPTIPFVSEQIKESIRGLAIGQEPNPLPTLYISTPDGAEDPLGRIDVDFTPVNKGVKGSGTAGVMRGAQRGAF